MTTPNHQHRPGQEHLEQRRRDPVAASFAAALAGDLAGEDALRAAALVSDRAGDALWALAVSRADAAARDPADDPAATANLDHTLAFLRAHLAAARAAHLADHTGAIDNGDQTRRTSEGSPRPVAVRSTPLPRRLLLGPREVNRACLPIKGA